MRACGIRTQLVCRDEAASDLIAVTSDGDAARRRCTRDVDLAGWDADLEREAEVWVAVRGAKVYASTSVGEVFVPTPLEECMSRDTKGLSPNARSPRRRYLAELHGGTAGRSRPRATDDDPRTAVGALQADVMGRKSPARRLDRVRRTQRPPGVPQSRSSAVSVAGFVDAACDRADGAPGVRSERGGRAPRVDQGKSATVRKRIFSPR